ncbi:GNAT family N-acetyltransferase [Oxalobacter vibrioformis]|uniref:GNAT family N-acetyltransferase n=1 Tax=Oxalobacter vibrioformis TaxID=933080 RepID=A0A9E9P3F1_9BURK|nr:GNAT family N-acetyltransferase [Oxalobacter vibrioformis]WAW10155.1 GNAT family N-acetyltransferase [Oxalobacter vibrioformis]
MMAVSPLEQADCPAVWCVIKPVFRSGEAYVYPRDISESEAYSAWVDVATATYVAKNGEMVLGMYYLKPNQPAQGSHVCNCGYIVGANVRGKGVASLMCAHSQQEALRLGFSAMPFNLVVSTNESAIRLWQKNGFEIVGRLPGAFHHPVAGFVDAFVMLKKLL